MTKTNLVATFLKFQKTGEDFEGVWANLGPIVEQFAQQSLRKLGVYAAFSVDTWAADDVVSVTKVKLLSLAKPNAKGRFAPSKSQQQGLSGLRGWLSRIVRNEAVNWTRTYRHGRGVKITPESGFEWNDLPGQKDVTSILKRQEAKVQRADLLPILEECIDRLTDPLQRRVVRLKLNESMSERDTARTLGTNTSMVHRRLHEAYALLRPMLEERGVDLAWLAA